MGKTLKGKVALVTGGSRGIGAATARALAEQGADVAISFVASAEKAEAVVEDLVGMGVRARAHKADQGSPEEVTGLVDAVVEHFGRLDILVNNAAIWVVGAIDAPDADIEAFSRQYAVNFSGVVAGIRAAARVMEEGGRIISVGSGTGTRVGWPGLADYVATKTGVIGYSKGAARDLAPRGITVNVVQAGCVDTDMNPADSELAPTFLASVPLGRYARPEEIAAAIVFLAGPGGSYITGTVLNVDGGYNA
ncbi:SDR family oxidoreductase [Microtetraspora sp. AC03309]|uniref:SDR family NAD(P)-dependent oxidoreductase n=1 Tax=Microtetraspora sp. AC03309 TaxID=2779376 RepID=UPI001E456FB7|nr:SDR family oxidoreductase [Microtetraspora sp. AC03309]MCC5578826.1 SDR family oxidoreductase [Microtetraspora sp. AC03309]